MTKSVHGNHAGDVGYAAPYFAVILWRSVEFRRRLDKEERGKVSLTPPPLHHRWVEADRYRMAKARLASLHVILRSWSAATCSYRR